MKKLLLLLITFFTLFAYDNFNAFYPDFNAVKIIFNSKYDFFKKGEVTINNIKYPIFTKTPQLVIESIYKDKNKYDITKGITQYNISYNIKITKLNKINNNYQITNDTKIYNEQHKLLDYQNLEKMEFFIRDFHLNISDVNLIEIEIDNIYNNNNNAMFFHTINKPKIAFICDEIGDIKKSTFGSIWKIFDKEPAIGTELRPMLKDLNSGKAAIANEAYTRVAGNDIYLALLKTPTKNKIKFYSNTDRVKTNNNIIIYKKCDFAGCIKDYVVNADGPNEDGLATGDYVIEFINTSVGKHDICYEEINNLNEVVKNECRVFTVRPALIKLNDLVLDIDNSFLNITSKIHASIYDAQDRIINTNNIGIKHAKLKVFNSINKEYEFDLENKYLKKISKENPAIINSHNELELKIAYPFSNKGKISFIENDFVGDDISSGKCHLNGYSNIVNANGKVSCNIQINDINIDFKSNTVKVLNDIKTSNNLSDAVLFSDEVLGQSEYDLGKCVGLNCDFIHSLEFSILVKNQGITNSSSLVYKYFPNDFKIEFDLGFSNNKDIYATKRYRIYTNKLIKQSIDISNQKIKMSLLATKKVLNQIFDDKLANLDKDVNIYNNNLSAVANNYLAKENDLEFITKIGYTKFYETQNFAPTNKALSNPNTSEFNLDNKSIINIDGVDNLINKTYSFIFANARYMDVKAPKNSNIINLQANDLNINYIDTNGNLQKLLTSKSNLEHYYLDSLTNIIKSIQFNSDYNSKITKMPNATIQIELDKSQQNNEYVKDIIRMYSKNVISSNSAFSIEFRK